ncbi:hypothetical protein [Enterococcus phage vB_Efs4_KEN02]
MSTVLHLFKILSHHIFLFIIFIFISRWSRILEEHREQKCRQLLTTLSYQRLSWFLV